MSSFGHQSVSCIRLIIPTSHPSIQPPSGYYRVFRYVRDFSTYEGTDSCLVVSCYRSPSEAVTEGGGCQPSYVVIPSTCSSGIRRTWCWSNRTRTTGLTWHSSPLLINFFHLEALKRLPANMLSQAEFGTDVNCSSYTTCYWELTNTVVRLMIQPVVDKWEGDTHRYWPWCECGLQLVNLFPS